MGRLLGELERLGMADNTLVLFTADHGNMLGDRGRMFKGIMYEGSTHVPLIWRGPKGAAENNGRVEHKLIENTDLLPSILETAGLPVPERRAGLQFPQARARGRRGLEGPRLRATGHGHVPHAGASSSSTTAGT